MPTVVEKLSSPRLEEEDGFKLTFVREWTVIVDDPSQGLPFVRMLLPPPFHEFPGAPAARLRRMEIRRKTDPEDLVAYEATARYSNQFDDPSGGGGEQENPLLDPPRVSWVTEQFERAMVEDLDGKAITNTLGEFISGGLVVENSRRVLTVQRNLAFVNTLALDNFQDAVNSDTFFGRPPHTFKVSALDIGERQVRNGIAYHVLTARFSFNPDKWHPVRLVNKKVNAETGDEVRIDEDGQIIDNPTTDSHLLEFRGYELRAFSGMGLGI